MLNASDIKADLAAPADQPAATETPAAEETTPQETAPSEETPQVEETPAAEDGVETAEEGAEPGEGEEPTETSEVEVPDEDFKFSDDTDDETPGEGAEGEDTSADPDKPAKGQQVTDEEARELLKEALIEGDEKKIIEAVFKHSRPRRAFTALKALRPIEESTGQMPSPEEVEQAFLSREDFQEMLYDFQSGDPQRLFGTPEEPHKGFFPFWIGADQPNEGAAQAISQLPQYLASREGLVPLYEQLASPIIQNYYKAAYSRALKTSDPDTRAFLTNLGNFLMQDVEGYYDPPEGLAGKRKGGESARPKQSSDPDVERQRREIQEERQRIQDERFQAFRDTVNDNIDSVVTKYVDEALQPARGSMTEVMYNRVRNDFVDRVESEAMRDGSFKRLFQRKLDTAFRSGQRADIDDLVQSVKAKSKVAIRKLVRPFYQEYGLGSADALKQNQERRARLEKAAGKVGTVTAGRPAPQLAGEERPGQQSNQPIDLTNAMKQDIQSTIRGG